MSETEAAEWVTAVLVDEEYGCILMLGLPAALVRLRIQPGAEEARPLLRPGRASSVHVCGGHAKWPNGNLAAVKIRRSPRTAGEKVATIQKRR